MLFSGLMLTAVNLLLRFSGMAFQVYLSGAVGAAGLGLIQLILSAGGLATVAGMAGVRTACMYLTAQEANRTGGHVGAAVSGCFLYSIVCSCAAGLALFFGAPFIAKKWIGSPDTAVALRLSAATVPISCLCGVLCGYFTAVKRVGTLSAVEIAEQAVSLLSTVLLLELWAKGDSVKAACSLVLGGAFASVGVLICLAVLYFRAEKGNDRLPMGRCVRGIAVPLAAADLLRSGISSVENMMVPKRLGLFTDDALGAFGTVSGMVFPVLMFPACLLFGLCELLIPELAGCSSRGDTRRIARLARRSLRIALIYGCLTASVMAAISLPLCRKLYASEQAGKLLYGYAFLVPMLYCDMVIDSMVKGLGHQKANVRYNILTNALDVVLLFFLLPRYGLTGYFISFIVTHGLNFCLSLRRLLSVTKLSVRPYVPLLCLSAQGAGVLLTSRISYPVLRGTATAAIFLFICVLTGIFPCKLKKNMI